MQRQASDSGNYNSTNSNSHPSSNTADATPNERSQLTREMTRQEAEQEKKDIELAQLLEMMVDWKPIIPDEVIDYYLQKSGFETDDLRVKRLLSLAAQRFVSSISADAFQYARTRTTAAPGVTAKGKETASGKGKDKTKTVLTQEDLSSALNEYGIGSSRASYYL